MKLTSNAFREGSAIPVKYTGDGSDLSPPLAWKDSPPDTKSFALICDDPDARADAWVHWIIYNIPPGADSLAEGIDAVEFSDDGIAQGINDFGGIGYGGPLPPRGTHRYVFRLYALDMLLPARSGIRKSELLKLMNGHILAETKLMGLYSRG